MTSPPGWHPHPSIPRAELYWDGTHWTETRKLPPGKTDPTFAWTMALLPLADIAVTYLAPEVGFSPWFYAGYIAVNVLLAILDGRRLEAQGHQSPATIAVLIIPVYLIWRTIKVHSTPAIPVAWFLAFGLSLLPIYQADTTAAEPGGTSVAGQGETIEVDVEQMEIDLLEQAGTEYDLTSEELATLTADCSSITDDTPDAYYACDLIAGAEEVEVFVTLDDDGTYAFIF